MDMKQIKNEHGFTLIELLAVIVVLAIVMLIAATAVLPRMAEARRQVFAIEANNIIETAQTYFMNNSLTGTGGQGLPNDPSTVRCITITKLIEDGVLKQDKSKASGKVLVKKKSKDSDVYLYAIWYTNGKLMVTGKGLDAQKTFNADISASDVEDNDAGKISDWEFATCGATETFPTAG